MAESLAVQGWDAVKLNSMRKVRKYVQAVIQTVPRDGLGRLSAMVDPTVIMQTGMVTDVEHFVDAPPAGCLLPVSLLEGIPTLDGTPVWEKWDNEPVEYYELFKRYRNIQDIKTTRSVYKLAVEQGLPTKNVELLRQIYQWQDRCLAWDEYTRKERELQLELRRQEIENRHATTAEKLFKMASSYLEDHADLITPKVALTMLELAIRLERVAAGMSLDNRKSGSSAGEVAINIQNNLDNGNGQAGVISNAEKSVLGSGNSDEARARLTQVVNVMNNLGIIKGEVEGEEVEGEVIEVETDEH